jgi:hypothetical protein
VTKLVAILRALRNSRWIDLRDAAEAQVALLRAMKMQWLSPAGELVELAPQRRPSIPLTAQHQRLAARLSDAVDRAARYGVWHPLCLTRALALSHMLKAHGISAHRIRIGVRSIDDQVTAHAWVELGGVALGDPTVNTAAYTPLTEVFPHLRGNIFDRAQSRIGSRHTRKHLT